MEGAAKGYLQLITPLAHLRNIISDGHSEVSVFETAGSQAKGGWFFTSNCPVIKSDTLLIDKVHAESLRLDLLAKTTLPAISVHPAAPLATPSPVIVNEYLHRKYYTKSLSWLRSEYVKCWSKGKVLKSERVSGVVVQCANQQHPLIKKNTIFIFTRHMGCAAYWKLIFYASLLKSKSIFYMDFIGPSFQTIIIKRMGEMITRLYLLQTGVKTLYSVWQW